MRSTLSTMSPVPWTVLTHDLRANAKDPMTSPAVHRLSNFALSITEKQRVLSEIADRASGIVTERSDKATPDPNRGMILYVWSKGREYRFESVGKAADQGFTINSRYRDKIRVGGYHYARTGAIFWSAEVPDFIQHWRDTGVMNLPPKPKSPLMVGRTHVPCFSYIRGGTIEYHPMMKEALIRATGKTHGNIKNTITKGVGHFHFRNGSWVWRATVPTPAEVVMLMANPSARTIQEEYDALETQR